jgi:hypothetical protein
VSRCAAEPFDLLLFACFATQTQSASMDDACVPQQQVTVLLPDLAPYTCAPSAVQYRVLQQYHACAHPFPAYEQTSGVLAAGV